MGENEAKVGTKNENENPSPPVPPECASGISTGFSVTDTFLKVLKTQRKDLLPTCMCIVMINLQGRNVDYFYDSIGSQSISVDKSLIHPEENDTTDTETNIEEDDNATIGITDEDPFAINDDGDIVKGMALLKMAASVSECERQA